MIICCGAFINIMSNSVPSEVESIRPEARRTNKQPYCFKQELIQMD